MFDSQSCVSVCGCIYCVSLGLVWQRRVVIRYPRRNVYRDASCSLFVRFRIYPVEMFKQPIFIFHHTILLVASLILPSCPGCVYTVFAVALAEAGSLSIAVDSEWRKTGGTSRGFKRVVIFGASRVLNLYLLYKIYLVTPSRHIITLTSMDHGEMVIKHALYIITQ